MWTTVPWLHIHFLSLKVSCCPHWPRLSTSSSSCSSAPGGPSVGPSTLSSSAACASWWPSLALDTSLSSTSTSSSSSRRPSHQATATSGQTHVELISRKTNTASSHWHCQSPMCYLNLNTVYVKKVSLCLLGCNRFGLFSRFKLDGHSAHRMRWLRP